MAGDRVPTRNGPYLAYDICAYGQTKDADLDAPVTT